MPAITPAEPILLGAAAAQNPTLVPTHTQLKPTFVQETPPVEELSQDAPIQDPTKPWMDLDYDSSLPVVPVFRPAIFDSAAPAWGWNTFNIGDLNVYNGARATMLKAITADTKSDALNMGVNHVDVSVLISDLGATCDLNIYQVDSVNGDVLMKSWVGVTQFVDDLFIGGQDGIYLSGAQLKFEIKNITGGATVTVNVEGHH